MENVLTVSPDVKWIGIRDFDIVAFDIVMETKYGTTYNSYFINAEKKAVVETAKEKFKDQYIANISAVCDPSEIEYIICNHTEPDHAGSVKHLLKLAPNATVVGSGQALNYLGEMIDFPFNQLKVKDGDTLDLGNKTLKFIGAPNLHWPDSIYTYLVEEKMLFTCDSFGAHFCSNEMFDDLLNDYSDSYKYYFDVILRPFSKFMLKAIEKIRTLEINMICPGHGPILRSTWSEKIDVAERYSRDYMAKTENCFENILIAYVSAYGYTREMAQEIADGIQSVHTKAHVELLDLEHALLGDIEERITMSNAIVVGSPTINQNTLLPVYKMFALINPIRDKGKFAAAFGSYGWSGEAVKIVEENLKVLKLNVIVEGLAVKFYPGKEKIGKFNEFGKQFAEAMLRATAEKK